MSDEGEKTCPLCAEEMDLTDQQLKPCKCGYEICVWCWHHIMDMAEKDETEGRCPACRTAYNKEKIVGTGANCGRMVSDMNVEKKHKAHKGKSKTSEGRKQLGSVRVIQRNLVYVVGLPLSFAEEDQLLQRRDYFGQYGKVMKVSVSRTATGAIQHYANSTCSVYITYSKEEEAVRCIQSVHGFILDGRPLRACFGTTKYCHAWLRNMPCSNPDCLYLHEVGSQEDSFTKDEIISAYTRVQQITGASNSMQRRSGNVLPPPADEYYNNGPAPTAKPITKTAVNTNNSATSVSPPNSSSGRSAALPAGASWGTRSSSNHSLPTSIQYSDVPVKQKPDSSNGPVPLCTAVASPSQAPALRTNTGKKFVQNEEGQDKNRTKALEPLKNQSNADRPIAVSESSASAQSETLRTNREHNNALSSKSLPNTSHVINPSATSTEPVLDQGSNDAKDRVVENMGSSILSMSIHENQRLTNCNTEHSRVKKVVQTPLQANSTTEDAQCDIQGMDAQPEFRLEVPSQAKHVDLHEVEDDLLSFDNQRAKDPEIVSSRMQDFSNVLHQSKPSFHTSFINPDGLANIDLNRQVVNRDSNLIVSEPKNPIGHSDSRQNFSGISNGGYSSISPAKDRGSVLRGYDGEVASESVHAGESSIITKFLSMDFDPWDDTLTSFTQGSFGAPGSRKTQNSNQSKFSFAREQEPISQVSDFGQPAGYFEQSFTQHPASHGFSSNNDLRLEKPVSRNGFPAFSGSTESDIFANGQLSMNKSAASRSQISAPPGFSAPSRSAAPPGFTPHERTEQFFDMAPANMLDASSLLRNQYQTPLSSNSYNNGDIEFMDPAILAVGKGTIAGGFNNTGLVDIMSGYTPQSSTYEEARFPSYQQRSLQSHQNPRFADMGDQFSMLGDAYGHPSRVIEHAVANNRSPFSTLPQSRNGVNSNGQWDSWNQIQGGNNIGMAELLRNERLGYNNFYPGYEDSKIRMPTSGNLYNGTYGI